MKTPLRASTHVLFHTKFAFKLMIPQQLKVGATTGSFHSDLEDYHHQIYYKALDFVVQPINRGVFKGVLGVLQHPPPGQVVFSNTVLHAQRHGTITNMYKNASFSV